MEKMHPSISTIDHLKSDGWLRCNHLKGPEGDSMNVLLSYTGNKSAAGSETPEGQLYPNFLSLSISVAISLETGAVGGKSRLRSV